MACPAAWAVARRRRRPPRNRNNQSEVRRALAQVVAAIPIAIGLSSLASLPASARDYFGGPLEIRIIGADDEIRDFMAGSSEGPPAPRRLPRPLCGARAAAAALFPRTGCP